MSQNDSKRKLIKGRAIPLRGNNIDTDRIIPARYLRLITFESLGQFAFQDERFDDNGKEKDHPFNEKRFKGAEILLVNKNFGCGSSREHAPQSLMRMGIRGIVGESFAEIFAGNCTALGIPAVCLKDKEIDTVMTVVDENPATAVVLDLEKKTVTAGKASFSFTMPEPYRRSLTSGAWDTTAALLENLDLIEKKAKELPYIAGY